MISVSLATLLDYSEHERAKWKARIAADPKRLALVYQPGGRFPTLGALLDHIFLVERRHLSRLQGATPPDASGVTPGDVDALFEYAALVRADFRKFVADLNDAAAKETITFAVQSGTYSMKREQLSAHVLLHEIRHLAQAALAARLAGDAPPGEHDYFYFTQK